MKQKHKKAIEYADILGACFMLISSIFVIISSIKNPYIFNGEATPDYAPWTTEFYRNFYFIVFPLTYFTISFLTRKRQFKVRLFTKITAVILFAPYVFLALYERKDNILFISANKDYPLPPGLEYTLWFVFLCMSYTVILASAIFTVYHFCKQRRKT